VAKAFPDWKPVNVGFGGSEIRDVTHFADRVLLKHKPRAIVFYAGDNDVNASRTPEQVLADFRAFVAAIHKQLPKTQIHFICIKPSIARWTQFEKQSKANALVRELCSKDDRLSYIDIVAAMLGDDGKPRPELFVKDGLHFSAKGYEVLNEAVRKGVK
jgi:lysophospholipase L1-like esterase